MTDNHRVTGNLYATVEGGGNLLIANGVFDTRHDDGVVMVEAGDLVDLVKLILRRRPDMALLVAAAAHDAGYAQAKTDIAAAHGRADATGVEVIHHPDGMAGWRPTPGPVADDQRPLPTVAAIVERLTAEDPYGPGQVYRALLDPVDEVRALAAVVEGQQLVIDALISRCDAIDQAKASATWVADLPSRDWVKDQIGRAITKHAGAMHARIEQILGLAKRYTDAAVSRPGLARRLWSAFVAAPAVAERVPGAAAAQAVGHVFTTAEVERAVVAAVAKAAGSEVNP